MAKTLFLLSTDGCHLCIDAQGILKEMTLNYDVIDIIDDESLINVYGDKIPVLLLEGAEQGLFWPFEKQQIEQYLDHYGINSSN